MFNRNRRALAVFAFFFFALTAWAHRYHAAISTVTRDNDSGTIEIEHRLFMHDLEPILLALHNNELQLDGVDGEAAIRAYVEQHFAVLDAQQQPLALQWVGVELDQTYATIYQELPSAPPLPQLFYRNQLLTEIPTQVNTVNLNDGLLHTSLVFTHSNPLLQWPVNKLRND